MDTTIKEESGNKESGKKLPEAQKNESGCVCPKNGDCSEQKQAKPQKSVSAKSKAADFKRKYYDYYDDVKDHTKGREDW